MHQLARIEFQYASFYLRGTPLQTPSCPRKRRNGTLTAKVCTKLRKLSLKIGGGMRPPVIFAQKRREERERKKKEEKRGRRRNIKERERERERERGRGRERERERER